MEKSKNGEKPVNREYKNNRLIIGFQRSLNAILKMALYTWGQGKFGQLGNGNQDNQLLPTVVSAVQGTAFTKVIAGEKHSLAISEHGHLYGWYEIILGLKKKIFVLANS